MSASPCRLTPYSQVEFESNRYSVPADKVASRTWCSRPIRSGWTSCTWTTCIASHPRCYGKNQDIFDPLHYLPLLEQRPGAFQHAKPLRRWRATWPPVYERLLAKLQAEERRRCASSCGFSSCTRSTRPTWSSRR